MNATILPEKNHYPVLLNEIISIITPQYGGTFIDCTFGQGGYSAEILNYSNTKVIAFDRDPDCLKIAKSVNKKFGKRLIFNNKKFSDLDKLRLGSEKIDSIIFDLGYSYTQIKDLSKGLSFNSHGKLNMKMGINDFSADDVINKLDKFDLAKIFKFFGDDKDSKKIANKIIKYRSKKKINTEDLVKIIQTCKTKKNYKIHVATKIFQALRIFVNKEISELIFGLINATKILKPGGKIVVVTFHSLEDKIVKFFFKSMSEKKSFSRYVPDINYQENLFKLGFKKPIIPSKEEINVNPASRSAKLRFVTKERNISKFESQFLEKFNHLLEIENLSKKL